MLSAAKDVLRSWGQASGALPAWHRWRNRHNLTVVMFHRVLDPADPRWPDADPEYTIAVPLFAACLAFFQRHYQVIGLPALLAAQRGVRPLPDLPLLITFDDGWADNSDYALPLLQRAGLPAVVFVASDPVRSPESRWWQEELFRAERLGALQAGAAAAGAVPAGERPMRAASEDVFRTIARLSPLDADARTAAVAASAPPRASTRRDMMTVDQVAELPRQGLAVGSHGASHVPLAGHGAAHQELQVSRQALEVMLGTAQPEGVIALSYPHGRYAADTVSAARSVGYALQFTSDPVLNRLEQGTPRSDLLGRIAISADAVATADNRLRPERLAVWLFTRPARCLTA